MKEDEIFRELHKTGCCNGCCARFLGLRTPSTFENLAVVASKYLKDMEVGTSENGTSNITVHAPVQNGQPSNVQDSNGSDGEPVSKRRRWSICVCCLGILQKETWDEAIEQVIDSLGKRGYDTSTFACALSSPACIALREKSLQFHLQNMFPDYQQTPTPLKEAWKWCFGNALGARIKKTLDSGAVCPLLVTINMDYDNDAEELDSLKSMAPQYYSERARNPHTLRRPETTRRCVADVLAAATADDFSKSFAVPPPEVVAPARAMSVRCTHAPVYLAGRYIKLSRQLSQTPWLIDGKRMMESSVQDVIFAPIARYYGVRPNEQEERLKLVAAGREDVDVRCLGTGRPFVVEVSDPHRSPAPEDLERLCREISASNDVLVKELRMVGRDDLALLKKGEEFKEKTYRALCIKLPEDIDKLKESDTHVTDDDIRRVRTYTDVDDTCRVKIRQKTPLRVLHRRPLLTRERKILYMDAEKIPGHTNLFTVDLRTEAGTYVKEFIHGDFGRTKPCLRDVLGCNVDILALDVTQVHLDW